eukprot:jgi/Chlat1/4196/Chrsp27S04283
MGNSRGRRLLRSAAAAACLCVLGYFGFLPSGGYTRQSRGLTGGTLAEVAFPQGGLRVLLQAEELAPFPANSTIESTGACDDLKHWERSGGVAVYIAGLLYLLLGVGIVCEEYFAVSLELLVKKLNLPEDVAGATFMAAGTSAPELFASLMALLNPSADSDVGIATIVGSAVYNILVIVALCVLVPRKSIQVEPRSLSRDCFFYGLAIVSIIWIFYDGVVHWWEGLICVMAYMCYGCYMAVDKRFSSWLYYKFWGAPKPVSVPVDSVDGFSAAGTSAPVGQKKGYSEFRDEDDGRDDSLMIKEPPGSNYELPSTASKHIELSSLNMSMAEWPFVGAKPLILPASRFARTVRIVAYTQRFCKNCRKGVLLRRESLKPLSLPIASAPEQMTTIALGDERVDANDDDSVHNPVLRNVYKIGNELDGLLPHDPFHVENPFAVPNRRIDKVFWLLALPWQAAYFITIPNCKRQRWRPYFLLTFIMAIVWMGLICWLLVEWATRVGCILNIPSAFMGVTILAAGTSLPDTLASVAVAKTMPQMALANALGSNIFDVWIALGVPWLFVLPFKGPIRVPTSDLLSNSLIMAAALCLYYISVMLSKWRMKVGMGFFFLFCYVMYVAYNVVFIWILRD